MRKGLNYWSFPGGLEGAKDIKEAVRETKELGYEGLEVCLFAGGALDLGMSDADVKALRKTMETAGVQAASVTTGQLWATPLTASDPKVRDAGKQAVKQCLRVANGLGATGILVVPGAVEIFFDPAAEIVPYETAMGRVREAMDELVPVAEKQKVAIGIENVWNKLFLSPLELRDFIDSYGSEYLGSFFDVGNIVLTGFPEDWIRILGKRIKKVHFKDFRRSVATLDGFVDLLEGSVNWPEVVKALREVGYDDYCIAEMIPYYAHAPETRLENTSRAMDRILAM
jgi:L-ribulose-5-phosphate 3-epimerase